MEKQFEEKVMKASGYRAAKNRQLKLMRKGLDLGHEGKIEFSRDELHRDKPIADTGYFEGTQTSIPLKDTV